MSEFSFMGKMKGANELTNTLSSESFIDVVVHSLQLCQNVFHLFHERYNQIFIPVSLYP